MIPYFILYFITGCFFSLSIRLGTKEEQPIWVYLLHIALWPLWIVCIFVLLVIKFLKEKV